MLSRATPSFFQNYQFPSMTTSHFIYYPLSTLIFCSCQFSLAHVFIISQIPIPHGPQLPLISLSHVFNFLVEWNHTKLSSSHVFKFLVLWEDFENDGVEMTVVLSLMPLSFVWNLEMEWRWQWLWGEECYMPILLLESKEERKHEITTSLNMNKFSLK